MQCGRGIGFSLVRNELRAVPCGDADEARHQLKRLVSKTATVTQASMESHPEAPRRLKVLVVKAYGMENHVLLVMGAVPNLISWKFLREAGTTSNGFELSDHGRQWNV